MKAVTQRPSVGQGTAKTRVHLKPGLECEIEEGAWLTIKIAAAATLIQFDVERCQPFIRRSPSDLAAQIGW